MTTPEHPQQAAAKASNRKLVEGGKRVGHAIFDLVVVYMVLQVVVAFLESASSVVPGLAESGYIGLATMFLLWVALYSVYYFAFELFWQRTPGKFLTKSLVVTETGEKPSLLATALRTATRLVPFEALSCLQSRGWHDRWSDTYVVEQQSLSAPNPPSNEPTA